MPNYEILIRFDDRRADRTAQRAYFDTQEKYGACGMGHDKTDTSSLFIEGRRLNRNVLQRELGDNKILGISRI